MVYNVIVNILTKRGGRIKVWVQTYLVLVTVGAIFYGLFGSLFDHHFAERLPYHGHVFSPGAPPAHEHPLNTTHSHDNATGHDGILFLPGHSAQSGGDGIGGWQWTEQAGLLTVLPLLFLFLLQSKELWRFRVAEPIPPHGPPRLAA